MKSKNFIPFLTILFLLILTAGVPAKTITIPGNGDKAKVDVYYFHFNTRCATCRAVEAESKADISMLFGKDVNFAAYNLDKPAGGAKGKEVGVSSQTLLIVKGDKKINLTNEGFMYARTDPEKFKKIIEEKIKPLL